MQLNIRILYWKNDKIQLYFKKMSIVKNFQTPFRADDKI